MISKTKYLIIGAGLTGLSAAYHLSDNYILVERSNSPGGIASTFKSNGFKLDNSVHVLYFRNNSILNWIKDILNVDLLKKERVSSVWINGNYVPFPVQYNLSFFSITERIRCVNSVIHSLLQWKKNKAYQNYEEYSELTFGKYLTEAFVRPYNEKLFGVVLSELNTDWLGDYIPKTSRYKMLLSAVRSNSFRYGRNSNFYYPEEGGISTLAEKLSAKLQIKPQYNLSLEKIILSENIAVLSDNSEIKFAFLINTTPLTDFLSKIHSLPLEVLEVSHGLKKSSTTLLHIMLKGKTERKEHWVYVADNKIPFYRITIPGNINSENCSEGNFALTLEFGGNVYMDREVLKASINVLKKMGILNDDMTEMKFHWKLIDCGYVVYDKNRDLALNKISSFLENKKIFSVGRYGAWEYSNMEDALLHGKKIAEKLSGLN